ncbi:MAG: DUF6502 family protein [Polyangiaceae bacterium]|nr:DUF6502 family protein [Polyangiaceae bacterium]
MTLKEAALRAAADAFAPIVQLLLEMGVTSPEAEDTLRAVYISEAKSIAATRGDATKVRLAAMTGVHRNFISEALRKLPRAGASNEELQYAARRVMREWFEDARYRHANGELRTLRLTGPRSFETLVREHAARIDANSVLDELVRGAAVEMVGEDEVRARGDAPQSTGLDSESLEEMGRRMRDLGRTLKHNQMRPTEPRLVETALTFEVAPRARALLARNLKARCVQFIRQVSEELHNPRIRSRVEQGEPSVRLGLTVFYFEDDAQADGAGPRRGSNDSSLVVHKEQPT